MIDFYSAQLIARKIMDHTGMTPDEVLKLDTSEYARLSGRSTPVQAALRAIDAQVTQPLNPGPEAVAAPPARTTCPRASTSTATSTSSTGVPSVRAAAKGVGIFSDMGDVPA